MLGSGTDCVSAKKVCLRREGVQVRALQPKTPPKPNPSFFPDQAALLSPGTSISLFRNREPKRLPPRRGGLGSWLSCRERSAGAVPLVRNSLDVHGREKDFRGISATSLLLTKYLEEATSGRQLPYSKITSRIDNSFVITRTRGRTRAPTHARERPVPDPGNGWTSPWVGMDGHLQGNGCSVLVTPAGSHRHRHSFGPWKTPPPSRSKPWSRVCFSRISSEPCFSGSGAGFARPVP